MSGTTTGDVETKEISRETPWLAQEPACAHWFAVYTRAHHEKRVAQQLAGRGIEHFLPLYRSRRIWSDRRVSLDLPVFPGYLFARFAPGGRLRVLEAYGVVHLVGFNGQPCPLAESDIETLRAGLRGGLCWEPHPYLTAGARVGIVRGPLAGMKGILARKKNSCRVILSLDLIARSAAVEVDAADIEPAS